MAMLLWAFLAGILSFLSPCVVSIAPGYLCFITGMSFSELKDSTASRSVIIRGTLAFIFGFTLVFVLLGVMTSFLGGFFLIHRRLIAQIGGVLLILFGLHQGGWIRLPLLYQERRFAYRPGVGITGAFVTGLIFSFGWTPCVGPVLGSILALAGSEGKPIHGLTLLLVYSLGMAIPFALLALGFNRMLAYLNRAKPYLKYVERLTGAVLVLMGIALLTEKLSMISTWFMQITGGWSPEFLLPH
ncbi:MAG: cytochrome c biogenesis CcdA family protein [Limnochordia bacterium]|jgi:cytochrome c-type biogenesis protein